MNYARKNLLHISNGNDIKTNLRLQYGLLSGPKVAAQGLKLYLIMIEIKGLENIKTLAQIAYKIKNYPKFCRKTNAF